MIVKIDALILARLGSSRLPRKHMLEIDDKPIIQHLIQRISKCKTINQIIVCTTDNPDDDSLIKFLEKEKILWFRGDEHDIIKRLLDAAKTFGTDIIVDIEGDKIYTEPEYVDKSVNKIIDSNCDFVMGSPNPNFIDHTDHSISAVFPAVMKKDALEKLYSIKKEKNTETGYREYFTSNSIFKCNYISMPDLKIPKNLRLTLDYKEDFKLAEIIFKNFGTFFTFKDIIKFVELNPHLLEITNPLLEKWNNNYNKKFLK